MNHILELDAHGRTALVEAGAVNLDVDAAVKKVGLYYPPDPSSGRSAAIGGNLGTNAGGPHCFKYGVTTNYIMGVEAVLANGSIVQLGGPVVDAPEYDLRGLVVGSEGTLAIVTKATLRLIANPPGVKTMMVSFDSVEQAGQAVSAVIAAGLAPATLELMDRRGMEVIEEFVDAGLPVDAGAALIVEVDGYPESLDAQIEEIADLLADNGGYDIRIAQSEQEREQIWYGRKSAAGALARLATGYYLTDVTVRRSLLGQVLHEVTAICNRFGVETASFFHAGDGNLHPLILYNGREPGALERAEELAGKILRLCIELGGSITGEHGVGVEKLAYMPEMFNATDLAVMGELRAAIDPQGLANRGKMLPAGDAPALHAHGPHPLEKAGIISRE
jgi:glycolate oxidase subunit GlcD